MATAAAMSGVPYLLQDAQTVGNGNVACPPPSFRNHTFIIRGNGAIGAGAIQLETADAPDYSGTWAALPKLDGTASTPITVVGSAEIIFITSGIFACIRARISTTVTTTTVTVEYIGAKSY